MKEDRAQVALGRLVEEAKREPLPDVDWESMEARLMARAAETPRTARVKPLRPSHALVRLLAAAALAGTAAAAVLVAHRPVEVPHAAAPKTEATETAADWIGMLNGDALSVGASIVATDRPVVVDHEGHATWTLETGGVAHIEQLGSVVRVALDQGALSARVTKSTLPESFVVRIGGTRVAVHGTAFRVVRLEHGVHVEVTEGVVGVGPLAGPSFDVRAPSSATTTLDGVRTDQRHAARETSARGVERPRSGSPEIAPALPESPPADSAAQAPPPVTENAPQAAVEVPRPLSPKPSIDRVIAVVKRCFGEQTIASGDVHISVSTQMSLRIQPTGRVGEALFTPPLAPGVRHCVDDGVGAMRFSASSDGFAIDRVLELER